jgi:hypothetical protein
MGEEGRGKRDGVRTEVGGMDECVCGRRGVVGDLKTFLHYPDFTASDGMMIDEMVNWKGS